MLLRLVLVAFVLAARAAPAQEPPPLELQAEAEPSGPSRASVQQELATLMTRVSGSIDKHRPADYVRTWRSRSLRRPLTRWILATPRRVP